MDIKVYFTYKPYKDGFEFPNVDDWSYEYIDAIGFNDEEIINYGNDLYYDPYARRKVAFVVDKRSFEDRKIKVIYCSDYQVEHYICFRCNLEHALTAYASVVSGVMSIHELLDTDFEEDRYPINFDLLE